MSPIGNIVICVSRMKFLVESGELVVIYEFIRYGGEKTYDNISFVRFINKQMSSIA